MADLALRFNKDVLVLSAPVEGALARLGVDTARDLEFTLLFEPDTIEEAYRMDALAGAQCLVAPTAGLTPARLARVGMEAQGQQLACEALKALRPFTPQHVLVELAPCGLPLDPASKASLVEHRDQYARAARFFDGADFDGFLLSGFASCAELKCALMGVAKASEKPVLASVAVTPEGTLASGEGLEAAVEAAEDLGAAVVGFDCAGALDDLIALVQRVRLAQSLALPVLVGLRAQEGGCWSSPDALMDAGEALAAAGAQFLRATGDASATCTGALVAATLGRDVVGTAPAQGSSGGAGSPEEPDAADASGKAGAFGASGMSGAAATEEPA